MSPAPADRPSTSLIEWFWLALPYGLLVVTLAITLAEAPPADEIAWMLVLALVMAAWHWWWTIRRRDWLAEHVLPMAIYFIGMLVLTTALTNLAFGFFPLYLLLFALAFVALPGPWAYIGLAVTAVLALTLPWLLVPTFDNVAAIVGGGALASVAGWSIRALERSNERLATALDANLALQEQLIADARESGTVAERTRLAAELHDTIAAGLTGVVSQLEAIDAAGHPSGVATERIRVSLDTARETLAETRRAVKALRPGALRDHSLPGALAAVTSEFRRSSGITVLLHVTGDEANVPDAAQHVLVRAAQEALTNVARHAAGARLAHVTLSYLGDTVALDVSDDGGGMKPRRPSPGGHGLQIMRERAESVGGAVEVRSEPGRGTTVTVTVPLANGATHD